MTMLKHSQLNLWEPGELPSYQADSHASRLVKPGSSEARKMTVISGRKCLESLEKSGPLGYLQKTLLESSQWNSTMFYLTWKKRHTKQKRLYFQLVQSGPLHIRERVFIVAYSEGIGGQQRGRLQQPEHFPAPGHLYQWRDQPMPSRVAYGLPDRLDRIKALGNAVMPQVVYPIIKSDC
jgi:hypothetical protein